MNDLFSISKLKETISDYIRVKIELLKLDLTEHLANILSQVIAYIVILIMASLVIAFLSMGAANYFNERLGSAYLGQLFVAGFYLFILLIIFYFLRSGKLKSFFESKLIDSAPGKIEKEEDHVD